MLSYQHEYHAGNHADILKHICLCSILGSLSKKEKPFTLIDTHSGAGRFFLDDERLLKTGEALDGIKKFVQEVSTIKNIPQAIRDYLEIENPYLEKGLYAGSPEIERQFLRKGDICHLSEMHPEALKSLEENVAKNLITNGGEKKCGGKCVVHAEDSYKSLGGLVPPLVKRGLILCDPSYEDRSDYRQVTDSLKNAHKKWNTAIIALWYPILPRKKNETSQMLCELEDFAKLGQNPCETKKFELEIYGMDEIPKEMLEDSAPHMTGSGMFIINPPWQLEEKMSEALTILKSIFHKKNLS
ncbi:MAG: 23S rRNA (adenine(2030)-N(6))-methyltransferase RlmJ [Treponema sp.]|nr:23S rRNA (adenine(2030)-N(6))-methyltransferase RlmJ [Treponema sp.]